MTKKTQLQQEAKNIRERFNDKLSYELIRLFASVYFRVQKLSFKLDALKQVIKDLMLRDGVSEIKKAGVKLEVRFRKKFEIDTSKLAEIDPALYQQLLEPSTTKLSKMVKNGQISKMHLDRLLESGAVIMKESAALVVKET